MADGAIPAPGSTFAAEDGTVSTVLPENHDPNYEPSPEELEEYAEFLGIDVEKEPYLLSVAKEGLRTPLPDGWRACQTDGDEVYYFNFKTGESLWDHPMDAVFKERVTEERKRRQQGGSAKKAESSSVLGSSNVDIFSKPAATRATGSGSTKAIADSLFGKPAPLGNGVAPLGSKNPPLPPPLSGPGMPQPIPSRLGAPDVSGFLGHSSGLGGSLNASSRENSFLGGRAPTFSSPTSPVPMSGAKDIEANLRRRVEEEYAPQRRQLSIDTDKRLIESRRAIDEETKRIKAEIEAAWQRDKNKTSSQRAQELQREVKEVEENWAKRITQVSEQLARASKELEEAQKQVSAVRGKTAEELRKELNEKRAADVRAKRAALRKVADEEIARTRKEQDATVADLKSREARASSAARKRLEESHTKKLQFQQTQGEKMLSTLEAQVSAKRKELEEKGGGNASLNKTTTSSTPATTGELSAVEKKRLATEEKEADATVEQIAAACAADYTALQKSTQAELSAMKKELEAATAAKPGAAANTPAPSSTSPAPALTTMQQEMLRKEEERLKRDFETATTTFQQQTDALVLRQQKLRSGGVGSTATSATSSRAATVRNTPTQPGLSALELRLQRVEARHDGRMRQLRGEVKKAYEAKGMTDPRETESYAKQMVEAQNTWKAANPPPSAENILPKLETVPVFMATMSDMAEVAMPTEEEKKAAIAARLKQLREEHGNQQEEQLTKLEETKRGELETSNKKYRETRLAEVRARVEKHRRDLVSQRPVLTSTNAVTTPTTKTTDPTPNLVAAVVVDQSLVAQIAEAEKSVAALEAALATLQSQKSTDETGHQKRIGELNTQIAAAEKAIHTLVTASPPMQSAPTTVSALDQKDAEPITVTQLDYANYISNGEASAKEAALHAKWNIILEGLRRDIREETVKSASMSVERQKINSYSSQTTLHPHQQQQQDRSRTSVPPPSTSCATPLQAPFDASSGSGGGPIAMGTPQGHHRQIPMTSFAPTYDLPPHQQQTPVGAMAPYSINASTIRPSPVVLRTGGGSSSGGGGADQDMSVNAAGVLFTPYAAGNLFMPHVVGGGSTTMQPSFSGGPTVQQQQQPHIVVHQLPRGAAEGGASTHTALPAAERAGAGPSYADRVARLKELLRQRRRELQLRQRHLESLRQDWRDDMQLCRTRGDRAQARMLKEVKAKLEVEARALNREVVSLKEAGERLKREEARLAGDPLAGQPTELFGHSDSTAAVDSTLVLETLMRVAERTERLEALIMKQQAAVPAPLSKPQDAQRKKTKHPSPQRHHSGAKGASDAAAIERWLREQPK